MAHLAHPRNCKMKVSLIIREYILLTRMRLWFYTGFIPVSGALAMGMIEIRQLALLYIIGCLAHIRGFTMNDLFDREFDKNSPFVMSRPLAKGTISRTSALILIGISLLMTWFIIAVSFLNWGTALMALAAPLLGAAYNLAGKKILGSDVILAMSFFCVCLTGSFSVSTEVTSAAILISLFWAFNVLYLNLIAGLKDLEFDMKSGAKTLAIALGGRAKREIVKISKPLKFTLFLIWLSQTAIISALFLNPRLQDGYFQSPFLPLFIFILEISIIGVHIRILKLREANTRSLARLVSLPIILNFLLVFLLLAPLTGIFIPIVIYIISLSWSLLFNFLTYGKPTVGLPPKKKMG